jgi:uncharacterized membrane protein
METKKIIFVLIILGLLLRLWGIGSESYWLDEAISVKQAQAPFLKSMELVKEDVHLPFYMILLNIWVYFLGTSEIATRLLSLIFGVISIYIIFLLGKKLFNKEVGLFSSFLLTFSVIAVYYSQETRLYSLFVLLTMLSFYFYIDLLKENNWKNKLLYFLPTFLLMYTHLFSFLSILVQNIYYILKNYKNKSNLIHWFSLQALLALLFLPWISVLTAQIQKTYHLSWINIDLTKIYYTFFDFFNHISILIIFVIALIFVLKKYSIKKDKNKLILLGLWALLPIVIVTIYSILFNSIYHTRYLLFALPAFYLIFSWTIPKLPKRIKVIVIIMIIITSSIIIYYQQQNLDKDNWRAVSQFVKNNVSKEEYVFIHPYYHQYAFSYYYDKECFDAGSFYSCNFHEHNILSLKWFEDCCNDSTELMQVIYKENQLKHYAGNTIWLINVRPEMYYQNNNLLNYFNERKDLTFAAEFAGGVEVYRFE